jgi:hypothetical protein
VLTPVSSRVFVLCVGAFPNPEKKIAAPGTGVPPVPKTFARKNIDINHFMLLKQLADHFFLGEFFSEPRQRPSRGVIK